ncbi:hypothetical protein [Thermococcus sp.]
MKDIRGYLLLVIFVIHGIINIRFFGFIPVIFTVIIPSMLYRYIAWALPFLLLMYFLLGAASVYYISNNPRRAFFYGEVYFLFGFSGSLAATVKNFPNLEMLYLWALSSIFGAVLLWSLRKEGANLNPLAVYMVIALLVVSGLFTFITSSWLAEDYYAHMDIGEGISKNASKVVGHPVQVPPPNLTNSSG